MRLVKFMLHGLDLGQPRNERSKNDSQDGPQMTRFELYTYMPTKTSSIHKP